MVEIPQAAMAFIGGSGTFALQFPEQLADKRISMLATDLVFPTPFGDSPPLKLFALQSAEGEKRVLAAKMHGRLEGVSWGNASQRLFWVLREAGVRQVVAEGGVGSVNHLLDPGDLIAVTDYIDYSLRRDTGLSSPFLLSMRKAICPDMQKEIVKTASSWQHGRVFQRGVYVVTDGRHFESPPEMAVFRQWGADVVGQTLCPEVYLAREIGACFAGLYLVVNYGEGIVKDWEREDLRDYFLHAAAPLGRVIVDVLASMPTPGKCSCAKLRLPTLLREENIGKAIL